ncbi:Glycosylphosphatidylinositol anchor attachment 1 protein [Geodia barretti]|uniref:Glycosylphosphatidylinositol anchor attachment 1 protein n=1 Tax=Geodia barretti TaxID=519541 RepID=A0AA35SZA1_GEOBA|nr:Glycosylphosphatidylinositol anchor attachment 1 protein [Geodia barretti]
MKLASLLESKRSKKLAGFLIKRRKPLGILLYLCGLVYLGMLPRDEFNRRSFVDENALMVGLVRREFRDSQSISDYAEELADFGVDQEGLMVWLEASFSRIGLEVYSQNYSAVLPAVAGPQAASVSGRSVYGVLRAGRASSAESLVFSAPSGEAANTHGLAVMLSLAKYFKSKNYWAKDIIFLVTTGGEIGVQAWINSYMGNAVKGINAGPLPGRSGAIQAVINLEIDSPKIEYARIMIEGVNGILPNLDLVHVLTHLSEMEGIPSALHMGWEGVRSHGRYSKPDLSDSAHKLYTVASLMAHQAPGLPLAGHAPFLRHRIDSVTVRGVGSGPTAKPLLNLARYLAVLLAEKTCIFSVSSAFCLPPGPWRVVFEASTISWRDSTIQSSSTMPRLAGDSSPSGCSCLPSASYWLHSCWRAYLSGCWQEDSEWQLLSAQEVVTPVNSR